MASADERFPRTIQVLQAGMEQGLHSGAQVYVSQNFLPVANFAVGENRPGVPLTPDTRMLWLSAGKPVTAVAVLQFIERGDFTLETLVSDLLPEFTGPGTERITIWNLLTHTAGLKPITTGFPELPWDDIIQRICAAGLKRDQTPGAEVGYDPGRTWFLLGEILQRRDGRKIDQIVRGEVLEPVGMLNSWMATPPEEYDADPERIGVTYTSKQGVLTANRSIQREMTFRPSPGSSMRGPIRELGVFYEMLLRNGKTQFGQQLLLPETVKAMTSRQRQGKLDLSFQRTIDFGLGAILNSARYNEGIVPYGYGLFAADSTFGHGGSQSAIGFADPVNQVVVAAITNGMPGDDLHNERFQKLNTAIYADLGLTTSSESA